MSIDLSAVMQASVLVDLWLTTVKDVLVSLLSAISTLCQPVWLDPSSSEVLFSIILMINLETGIRFFTVSVSLLLCFC